MKNIPSKLTIKFRKQKHFLSFKDLSNPLFLSHNLVITYYLQRTPFIFWTLIFSFFWALTFLLDHFLWLHRKLFYFLTLREEIDKGTLFRWLLTVKHSLWSFTVFLFEHASEKLLLGHKSGNFPAFIVKENFMILGAINWKPFQFLVWFWQLCQSEFCLRASQ